MTSSGAEAAEPVHHQEGAPGGGVCGVITQIFEGEMTGDVAEEEGGAVSG